MVFTMPASVFLKNRPWRTGIAGTVWNGEVGIAGGSILSWNWAPLRSLTSLGFAADWTAAGNDTDLGGRLLIGFSGVTLDTVSGSADATLLQALQPNLPFSCDFTMQVDMDRIVAGGGEQMLQGTIVTDPGSCTPRGGGAATPVPALLLTAQHIGDETRIRLTPAAQRRQTLVEATLTEDGTIDVGVTQDGARVLPFLGVPGGMRVQGQM
ncbi:hypothetical protein [Sphingosinithalassobacter sp. CS137]|uniref:hypothetical protein n=1 Tax=Sphingosinithalassobacter sp. CS137 TaxID=2762748 RepID=UPI00165E8ECC|nr:hypothetical protein [Sphingosinithalassobacter sp. CS137]